MAWKIEEELKEISDKVHPMKPEEEIAYIKRQAERRIAEIEEANREADDPA